MFVFLRSSIVTANSSMLRVLLSIFALRLYLQRLSS